MSGNPLDPVTTNRYDVIQASHAGTLMTADKTIFGLRFRSNERLQPSIDGLRIFLDSPKKEDKGKLHSDDLAPYRDLLKAVESFEHGGREGFSDRIRFAVLGHSHLVTPALKSAVEQYKYHMHNLSELDLKKPSAFIKSAEEEIARLNPKKKDEAARKERLCGMVEERKQALDALKKHWIALAEELSHIIAYIRDNLAKIEKLSEESIVILVGDQISRKKEGDLIEDIKTQFKERLRESLHQGTVTKDQLEAAKEEVAGLSKRTADLIRSDVYTLTQLYEAIHEYSGRGSRELDRMMGEIEGKKHASFDADLELYARVENILVLLTRECRFEIKLAAIGAETEHDRVLIEKRKEMLDHLLGLLHKGSS
jgi:GTPase SAR1 family protein